MALGPWTNAVSIFRFEKKRIFGDEEKEMFSSKRPRNALWRMIGVGQRSRMSEGTSRFHEVAQSPLPHSRWAENIDLLP
jgi:hypothetical protein